MDVIFFLLIFLSALQALLCAYVASDKQRTWMLWGLVAFFVPGFTLIALVAVTNRRDAAQRDKHHAELMASLKPAATAQPSAERPNLSVTGAPLA